jgi:hypothetical protein
MLMLGGWQITLSGPNYMRLWSVGADGEMKVRTARGKDRRGPQMG